MSSRLRTQSSPKASFFSFLDIITAVTGILILVTLILATDLGGEAPQPAGATPAGGDEPLQKLLRAQAAVEIENAGLRRLTAAAASAPPSTELAKEVATAQRELAALETQANDVATRQQGFRDAQKNDDTALGIDALREKLAARRVALILAQETNEQRRLFIPEVDRQILSASNRLAKAMALRGQSWLRAEDSGSGKRPAVILVAASGAEFKPLDSAETPQHWPARSADRNFSAFCRDLDSAHRYVVFLIRPSGISLFEELVATARAQRVEVGYDAITETQDIHVGPPPLDEPSAESAPAIPGRASSRPTASPPSDRPATDTASGGNGEATAQPPPLTAASTNPAVASPEAPPPPPKRKTWWERVVAFVRDCLGMETS